MVAIDKNLTPEIHMVGPETIEAHVALTGDGCDRWRAIFNELAAERGLPVDARGNRGFGFLVFTWPWAGDGDVLAEERSKQMWSNLGAAVEVATETDERFEAARLSVARTEVLGWWRDYLQAPAGPEAEASTKTAVAESIVRSFAEATKEPVAGQPLKEPVAKEAVAKETATKEPVAAEPVVTKSSLFGSDDKKKSPSVDKTDAVDKDKKSDEPNWSTTTVKDNGAVTSPSIF
jgi:hypothetical protein